MYFYQKLEVLELEPNDGKLFAKCKRFGFGKCYLETMPFMLDAQNYTKKDSNTFVLPWEAQATRVALLDAEEFMILLCDCARLDKTIINQNSSKIKQ
jgi:hypothetical protein